MTVQKDVTKNIYVGNGSTRTFPFSFECPAEHPEYIKVYLMQDDGTALATSDYQLDMDERQITYPSSGTALPEGKKLVIMRELPLQQMMNLVNNGPYFAEDIETAFDENVMAMQQIAEKLNRSIIMSVDIDGDAFVNEVPFEAGKSFRIADDGKSIVLTEDPARVLPLAQEAYAQAQAQAQSASASAAAAARSEDSAAASASEAGNSAQAASTSAASAKNSADSASTSKEAAQSAAAAASNFAAGARRSASEAKAYRDAASTYAANAKNYSENVNVFIPSVSSDGVLSWTNKAGLANPPAVNIGNGGSNVTVDDALSSTSTNAIQNKAVYAALSNKLGKSDVALGAQRALQDGDGNTISSTYIKFINGNPPDTNGNVNVSASGGGVNTDTAYTWAAEQNFQRLKFSFEKFATSRISGTYDSPATSVATYNVSGNLTLDMSTLVGMISNGDTSIFTAYIASNGSYALSITNAGTLKYAGSAADLAITASGLLLNIFLTKNASGVVTSIAQATKLS